METTLNFQIPLTFNQLAEMLRQLPKAERSRLVSVLQEEETSKEQILAELKEDYIALKKGTLKTRPLKDVLNEI